MIAAVETKNGLCVVKWTGRVRLHAGVIAYCGEEADASHGVVQVPDVVFTKGRAFAIAPGRTIAPCTKCRAATAEF